MRLFWLVEALLQAALHSFIIGNAKGIVVCQSCIVKHCHPLRVHGLGCYRRFVSYCSCLCVLKVKRLSSGRPRHLSVIVMPTFFPASWAMAVLFARLHFQAGRTWYPGGCCPPAPVPFPARLCLSRLHRPATGKPANCC